jgi:hypothetical protein
MKRKPSLLLAPFAVLLIVVLTSQGDTLKSGATADSLDNATKGAAGMRLYVDPATKEFVDSPVQPLTPERFEELQGLFNTSHEGLVEIIAPVGGGKMIDLKGRFQHAYTATNDASGRLSAGCGLHQTADPAISESETVGDQP